MTQNLGRVGLWSTELRGAHRPQIREAVAELDELGWTTLWLPGLDGAGALDDVGHLLTAAPHSRVVTGVLNIWGQTPADLTRRIAALDAAHGERTVVGLGIGSSAGAAAHGREYGSPVATMSHYLDGLGDPVPPARRLLGALGPRMVDLAVARTAGWHPFLVTPGYVAAERARVGAAALIAPHQAVVLETDPERARAAARAGIGMFLGFPTYQANLRRLGFTDDDLIPGGSDRLIDALVAHGTTDTLAARIREHLDAGADHVALHVLTAPGSPGLPRTQWRELAALTH
ncbi:TIGR03620 family F420-dependent LLM class oxidoreductase [Actinoplanes couchii]|uniref:LLM class F420-dependent oxidoreductase n=1 Tax=Actinoplanes couchii TaxID=403638 RepID=A0ABQ3XQC5_9ACTN|nr:TIGR03620 family F420-dependent LLM class oxidoreductase [Actinoplanes couchii]MDR6323042.1 putative F420-dependent oxidoreductase [Actinoplanes couchii]GID60715.1 LLM class F420-dependent oxidoreductase [Actinoplanes couchii]